MKQIQPISIWNNGQLVLATLLNAKIIADNLQSVAVVYYQLLSENKQPLAEGNITIAGEQYENWNGSNEATWQLVATAINVTITGDYTPQPTIDIALL